MKILVTGACGYKGHVLVPKLLACGHVVIGLDTQWFGNKHVDHPNLILIKGDVRDFDSAWLEGVDCILHLASIANDPCGDLNPKLTWEVSALATMQVIDKAQRAGVPRFIYASSGSVYGIKQELNVTEDLELCPVSEYNKTKMVSERVVLSYSGKMIVQIVRPATVCGFSPRMRLDVAVNLLTAQAFSKGTVTVLGGGQVRPNIHIEDVTDLYLFLVDHPELAGVYNAGFENLSILNIAEMVAKTTGANIEVRESNDPRSYRLNSDKLLSMGFSPRYRVQDAIDEIYAGLCAGTIHDEPIAYNLGWMTENRFCDL
jgi:nucleoside-diphosphate-sugar epimerase